MSSVFSRPQHTSLSKIDISEDNEPGLSKLDVVLSFTLEVSIHTKKRKAFANINLINYSAVSSASPNNNKFLFFFNKFLFTPGPLRA